MSINSIKRRDLIGGAALSALPADAQSASALIVDPQPRFDISPWLYMQFMEPLGATDSTVDCNEPKPVV